MHLGATKAPTSTSIHDMAVGWAEEAAAEAEASSSNPWGSDDLMDVNADQDDWSRSYLTVERVVRWLTLDAGAFESAPAAPLVGLHPSQSKGPGTYPSCEFVFAF